MDIHVHNLIEGYVYGNVDAYQDGPIDNIDQGGIQDNIEDLKSDDDAQGCVLTDARAQ